MKAMILAAGRGQRMMPLTADTPKPLLTVGGKALIVWHIERLANAGFKELVINHAYLGSQIEDALGDGTEWGVSIQYSPERQALETAGGIANARLLLGDAPFLVVNGDVFTDIPFSTLGADLLNAKLAHLVLVNNPKHHPEGDFVLENGWVKQAGSPMLTFSGVGLYKPDLFAHIQDGEAAKLAPILRKAMDQGLVSGTHYQGIWHDIGTPERLAEIDAKITG